MFWSLSETTINLSLLLDNTFSFYEKSIYKYCLFVFGILFLYFRRTVLAEKFFLQALLQDIKCLDDETRENDVKNLNENLISSEMCWTAKPSKYYRHKRFKNECQYTDVKNMKTWDLKWNPKQFDIFVSSNHVSPYVVNSGPRVAASNSGLLQEDFRRSPQTKVSNTDLREWWSQEATTRAISTELTIMLKDDSQRGAIHFQMFPIFCTEGASISMG